VPAPLKFSGLLRNSGSLYRRNFAALFVMFLPLGAAFFLAIAPLLALPGEDISLGTNPSLTSSLALALLTVLPIVVGGIAVATATVLLTARLVGQNKTVADAFRSVRKRLGPLFTAGLASSLVSIVLQLVLPPFAFFIHPLLYGPAVLAQVIVLEGADFKTGLTRAGELLQGQKLRVFMYLFAVSLGASLLDLLLPAFAGAALAPISIDAIAVTIGTLVQIIVTAVIVPFVAVAMLVAYFDLRARKEDLTFEELVDERAAAD
jgi:hypothetical protein